MKLQIFEQDGAWGWSIFNEYGDEMCASDKMFDTRELARAEAYAAMEDIDACRGNDYDY